MPSAVSSQTGQYPSADAVSITGSNMISVNEPMLCRVSF